MSNILIVDDDKDFAMSAAELARSDGRAVHTAETLADARKILRRERIDLLALDLNLPDGNGLDLLEEIDLAQHGRVVIVTGNPTLESAMRVVGKPIADYLIKPLAPSRWSELVRETCAAVQPAASDEEELLGASPALRSTVELLGKVAASDAAILITGESGTGKELAARTLHRKSGRSGPFVALNCGAVPSELLASELFGHERGSFTGASARHTGVFERAAQGTLFLDEVTEMPAALQVYLLRVLETKSIVRVGGTSAIDVPVRVVSATNRDPAAAVAVGALREDLYYRLADVSVHMPPLRARGDDVVILANAFVDRLNARYGQRKKLTAESVRTLSRHSWPGNARELRSAVQRAYLLSGGDELDIVPHGNARRSERETDTSIVFSVGATVAEIEQKMLLKTLAHCNNDKTATARILGVSVRTIHNQLARISEGAANIESATVEAKLATNNETWLHDLRNAVSSFCSALAVVRNALDDNDTPRAREFTEIGQSAGQRAIDLLTHQAAMNGPQTDKREE